MVSLQSLGIDFTGCTQLLYRGDNRKSAQKGTDPFHSELRLLGFFGALMFTTGQTFILNIVKMVLDLMERGGQALRGVTAHGSPGGPLPFDRLEAAPATAFP